jgi:hypothetical protein
LSCAEAGAIHVAAMMRNAAKDFPDVTIDGVF